MGKNNNNDNEKKAHRALVLNILSLAVVSIIITTSAPAYSNAQTSDSQNATTTSGILSATTTATSTNTTGGDGGPSNNMTTTITNATTGGTAATNATTTTTTGIIITNLTWFDGRVDQLSPQNIQYQHSDPTFAKLAQTTGDCLNDLNEIYAKVEANPQFREAPGSATAYTPGDIQGQNQCTDVINQGVAQFCESTEDSAAFDSQKCDEARLMTNDYVGFAEALFE